MSSDLKENSRSGGVEVVADQGDDGSYEIRLEKTGDVDIRQVDVPQESGGESWKASAEPTTQRGPASQSKLWVVALGVLLGMLIVGALMLMQSPKQLNSGRPKTVEVTQSPQFRGYTIEREAPEPAVNLRIDQVAPPTQPSQDDIPEPEEPTRVEWQNHDDDNRVDELRRVRDSLNSTFGRQADEPEDPAETFPDDYDEDELYDDEPYDDELDQEPFDDDDPDAYDDYE